MRNAHEASHIGLDLQIYSSGEQPKRLKHKLDMESGPADTRFSLSLFGKEWDLRSRNARRRPIEEPPPHPSRP